MKKTKKRKTKGVRSAIYSRVSLSEKEKLNNHKQQDRCIDYGFENGLTENGADIFEDTASGMTNADEREGLSALLINARTGRFKHVIVYKYDRLARNVRELLTILETLKSLGITVHSATEPIPADTVSGKFLLTMLMATTEYEMLIKRERNHNK